VIETVKKLGWAPDIVHCNDWMTSLIPMYLKTTYKNDPLFKETKTVFAIYNNGFSHTFGDDLLNKVKMVDIDDTILAPLKSKDFEGFIRMGMEYADMVVKGSEVSAELNQLFEDFSKDKKLEISIEEEQQAHEDLYGVYTSLAG
jgi:starch synthase